MENQLSLSGIDSQNLHHCRFFRRSRMICETGILNLKILEIGSSSCLCSTTLIGQETHMNRNVFQIPGRSRCTRTDSRKDIGRFLALKRKRNVIEYGNHKCNPEGKWNSVASKMVLRSEETGHPIFASASAMGRGILRSETGHSLRMPRTNNLNSQ